MKVQKSIENFTLYIAPEGRLDTFSSSSFEECFKDDLEAVHEVVLECKNLEYATSAGLRVMLEVQQMMEDKGGVLRLRNVNEAIMEILEVTGFMDFVEIEG